MLVLATSASVVASQALLSGVFSILRQVGQVIIWCVWLGGGE